MADWFKLHENWFTEPRLQWAIKEQPNVVQVWLWALTECCRTKSDTIGLHSEDYEMLGIQQLLNISPGVFNQSIGLLEKIKYIDVDQIQKTLKILKWNDFQSDYLRKKDHREFNKVRQSPTKSDSVSLEERRGEEIREEERREIKSEKPNIPPFFEKWNKTSGIPSIRSISPKRIKALQVRMRDEFFAQNWESAIERLLKSPFLTGKNDRGWVADIDWFLKPDSVAKIMEGKYDQKQSKPLVRMNPTFSEHIAAVEANKGGFDE